MLDIEKRHEQINTEDKKQLKAKLKKYKHYEKLAIIIEHDKIPKPRGLFTKYCPRCKTKLEHCVVSNPISYPDPLFGRACSGFDVYRCSNCNYEYAE